MTATQRFVSTFYRPVPCTFLTVKHQKLLIVVARIGALKSICNSEAPHKILIGYSEFQVVNFGSECNGEAPHKILIGCSEFQVVNFGSAYDHFNPRVEEAPNKHGRRPAGL